ncbi:MAG: phytanoyl-CoA dioxygenase family protein [Alphaproteobacteria bacterium]|nr:phytanoyl-CoA dioxygenase family protein [Alphaproteobacteria bacterium]
MTEPTTPATDPETDAPTAAPLEAAGRWYRGFQRFLLSRPDYAPFAQLLGGRDALALDPSALRTLHGKGIGYLHWRLNGDLRRAFIGAIDRYAREALGARPPAGADEAAAADAGAALDDQGWTRLPPVDPGAVQAVRDWFEAGGLTAHHDEGGGPDDPPEPAESLRKRANLGNVPRARLFETPHLLDLAADPTCLQAARRHLGAPPLLINITAWRSFAGEGGAKEARGAQNFHFDLDDYRFCKLFVYLTDVDEEAGPHVFVPTTHRPDVIAARRPPEGTAERDAFDAWYFKTLRKDQADVVRWLGIEPVELTGPAGARLMVNTEGIHRGAPPVSKDRWVLQFVYGVSPFAPWGDRYSAPPAPAGAYPLQLLFG